MAVAFQLGLGLVRLYPLATWKVSVSQLQVFLSRKAGRPSPPAASSAWKLRHALEVRKW